MKRFALCRRVFLGAMVGLTLQTSPAAVDNPDTTRAEAPPTKDPVPPANPGKPVSPRAAAEKNAATDVQPPAALSSQTAEIVKMMDSGVGAGVIQAQVEHSTFAYPPSADEIIYLHKRGVSAEIITAFIHRGGELRAQAERAAARSPSPAAQPAPATPTPPPAPPQTYAYPPPPAPAYTYTYPSYVYVDYPAYRSYWPSYWSFYWSYPAPRRWHSHWPTPYHGGPGRSYPHAWGSPSIRSPWGAPARSGNAAFAHVGFGVRGGSVGHFGGGFSGGGHRR